MGVKTSHRSQEREAQEQQELNELAETDPAEYDRRIQVWLKRKQDEKDSARRGQVAPENGDGLGVDSTLSLERRKALARERRDARYGLEIIEKHPTRRASKG